MSTMPIRTYPDPVLAQPTIEIQNIDAKIAQLAQVMLETMYQAPGVGLAANQIGIQTKIFVYDKGDGPNVVINPGIVETSGTWTYEEGCLSVPNLHWDIVRPNKVHLQGLDLDGNTLDVEVDEYHGRIFQHETDHLNGVLLIERLSEEQKEETKKELRRMRMAPPATSHDGLHLLFGDE